MQNSSPDMVFDRLHKTDHPFAFAASRALNIIPLTFKEVIFAASFRLQEMRSLEAVSHQEGRPFPLSQLGASANRVLEVVVMTMPQNVSRAQYTAAVFQDFLRDPAGQCHIWSAYSAKHFHLSGHVGLWCSIMDHYLSRVVRTGGYNGADRIWLFLEDDARPAEHFRRELLIAAISDWQDLQLKLHRGGQHPTALCVIGFHPRCSMERNHSLDTRPKHGMHGWLTCSSAAADLLARLQGVEPLTAPPIDIWVYEWVPEIGAQTTESLLGYIAHQSDTEDFHRNEYSPLPLTMDDMSYATMTLPLQMHPSCN